LNVSLPVSLSGVWAYFFAYNHVAHFGVVVCWPVVVVLGWPVGETPVLELSSLCWRHVVVVVVCVVVCECAPGYLY